MTVPVADRSTVHLVELRPQPTGVAQEPLCDEGVMGGIKTNF